MAEPTLTEILDAVMNLTARVDQIATVVDEISSALTIHRQDSESRTTNLDLSLRNEMAVVRAHVDAFQPQLDDVKAQQLAGDAALADVAAKVESLRSETGLIKADVAAINPKIDDVRVKQAQIIAQQGEPAPTA